jgi:hypothetical protein
MPAASHTPRTRANGIQIDEDLRFQARIWRIERIGWWGMAMFIAAAIAGLFGHGPISRTTAPLADPAHPGGGMLLDYERFGRAHSDSQFVLSGPARPPAGGNFSLWISEEYLTDAELIRITPEPSTQDVVSNGVRYSFRVEEGPRTVIFRFQPQRPGRLSGAFRLNDGPPTSFHQWLFP